MKMDEIDSLFEHNRAWSDRQLRADPDYFNQLAAVQSPQYLWIGCADSRVPANQITGLLPGEVFVHRNVSNIVVPSDLNCLSVLQFAVDVLKIRHVIVCGHYGCGGVRAALTGQRLGLIDNWLRHVIDVRERHAGLIDVLEDERARWYRLCELNVIEQAQHVCETTVVRDAWSRGQPLLVHGWIFGLEDGLLHDLGFGVGSEQEIATACATALERIRQNVP